jgi:outer membrane protein
MKLIGLLGTLVLSALSVAITLSSARADDGPWEVRLRGVYLDIAQKSDAIPSLGVPENDITVNKIWLPDLDFEYFVTPNWSTELVLSYPQSQNVSLGGTQIGTFKRLPPVLTAKYDFLPNQDFQPYVGVGLMVAIKSDVNIVVPGVSRLYLNPTSVGPVVQAGFDYKVMDHWYLNADIKWAKIASDLDLPGGTKISTLHLDPFLFGIGIGYRFGGH